MAKKKVNKPASSKPAAPKSVDLPNLFDKIEAGLSKKKFLILCLIAIPSLLFTALLYNFKISEANDDALYTEAAFNFSKNFFGYYTAYAPLYPMILSIIVKLFGINLFLIKFSGVIFMLLHFYFLFKAFEKRIPYLVLFVVIFITAINSYFLYYASMTFTEQFFLMLQGMFFYMFFKILDKSKSVKNIFGSIKLWVPVAALFFLISMTRNLALGILVPLLAFLIFRRQFIHGVAFIISFLLFRIPFEIFRRIMWGEQNQFANQMSVLIKQKDPYDVSKGVEDLNGYISRFTGNYGLYICKRFYQILGFLAEGDYQIRAGLGFVFFVLLILATIYFFRKKNDYLLFTLFYTVAMCCFTFIALQTRWDQYRFILIFVPFILILFLTAFYKSIFNNIFGRTVFLMTIIVLIFSSLITTLNKSLKSYPVVKKNFAGDIFYGYTPDWEHYLEMSKWVGDSLPNAFVACRKSPMSFIYANGKEFYPVYNVFSTDADTVLNTFKRNNVTHVILASLRRNPRVNDGTIINTVHRVIQPVAQKYPQKLSLVKQIGESEPAFLYKINY